jgi:hypothetical protein
MVRLAAGVVLFSFAIAAHPQSAGAWGAEGHRVIALVAQAYLSPDVSARVTSMLEGDTGNTLTPHDIADEATWADRFREANVDGAKKGTGSWHFIDIEIARPDQNSACFGHPEIPAGVAAYPGVARDCIVDKIVEFRDELASKNTSAGERLVALKFLLHFVGDLHQPLHAADDNDRGGNGKRITSSGMETGNLHAYWDVAAVRSLGDDPVVVARTLVAGIMPEERMQWSAGTPSDWAMEAFEIGKADAYGKLPSPGPDRIYRLSAFYDTIAERDTAEQLSKAGVRLASLLNAAMSPVPSR